MLDVTHLVPSQSADVQTFTVPASTTLLQWHTWTKPRGASMCYMFALGAGGGGGAATSAGSSGGGGGGGSGGQSAFLVPAIFLPDQLFIQVGLGGAGGATQSANGGNGTLSIIAGKQAADNTSIAGNLYLTANGGTGGTGGSAGAGGGGASAATAANSILGAGLGFFTFLAGHAGSAGGSNGTPGTDLAFPTTGLIVTGGAGGGGGNVSNGGNIKSFDGTTQAGKTDLSIIPSQQQSGTAGAAGHNGQIFSKPIFFTGGCGSTAQQGANGGGRGGFGSYGCGGGGSGNQFGTNGGGGDGGSGLVIIISW